MRTLMDYADLRYGDTVRIELAEQTFAGTNAFEVEWCEIQRDTASGRDRAGVGVTYFLLERPVVDYAVPVSKRRLDQLSDVLDEVNDSMDSNFVCLTRLCSAVNLFLGDLDGIDNA